jgi:pectinesterase
MTWLDCVSRSNPVAIASFLLEKSAMRLLKFLAVSGYALSQANGLRLEQLQERQSHGRTNPPTGCIEVGKSANHKTIASALKSLSGSSACIFINPGTYNEQLTIDYKGILTIYGSTSSPGSYQSNTVTISNTLQRDDPKAGNLEKSSTVNVISDNVKMYNINVKNGYGRRGTNSQAVALVHGIPQRMLRSTYSRPG